MTFNDMTPQDRAAALEWARSHDWAGPSTIMTRDGVLTVLARPEDAADIYGGGHCEPDQRITPTILGFTRMATLRAWAGY